MEQEALSVRRQLAGVTAQLQAEEAKFTRAQDEAARWRVGADGSPGGGGRGRGGAEWEYTELLSQKEALLAYVDQPTCQPTNRPLFCNFKSLLAIPSSWSIRKRQPASQ